MNLLEHSTTRNELNYAIPFAQYLRSIYLETGDFDSAADFTNKLADVVDDPSLRSTADELRQEYLGDVRNGFVSIGLTQSCYLKTVNVVDDVLRPSVKEPTYTPGEKPETSTSRDCFSPGREPGVSA